MKTTMLDYYKLILQKVSFNRKLFLKEYRKSHRMLQRHEVQELKFWLRDAKSKNVLENPVLLYNQK